VGVPTATARCMGPVLPQTNIPQRLIMTANCLTVVGGITRALPG
jgi:hypothetical protein